MHEDMRQANVVLKVLVGMLTNSDYCWISFHIAEVISSLSNFCLFHEIICAPDKYFSLTDKN